MAIGKRITGRHQVISGLFLMTGIFIGPPHTLVQARNKSRLVEICEKSLAHKIANSPIKRRPYHISKMHGPCKQALLLAPAQSSQAGIAYPLSNLKSKYASWGIDPIFKDSWINLVGAWKSFKAKKKVVVAVIDTGIDPNHKYLKENIHVVEGVKGPANYGKDFSMKKAHSQRTPSAQIPIDNHGHGTHVAGILKSVYPEVKILSIKYYNPNRTGQQNLKSLIQSLEYAINAGVDIINYSGGGPEPAIQELKILKKAERKGIIVVVAAGNESANIDRSDKAFYPASYNLSNIVIVTAHNQQTSILKSSNWGKNTVDLSAPGHRIRSSIPYNRSSYMTGTSQATAFVSGVVAMIKSQYPKLSAQDIKIILRRSAKKVAGLKKKCVSGGRLDATRALAVAQEYGKNRRAGQIKRAEGFDRLVLPLIAPLYSYSATSQGDCRHRQDLPLGILTTYSLPFKTASGTVFPFTLCSETAR